MKNNEIRTKIQQKSFSPSKKDFCCVFLFLKHELLNQQQQKGSENEQKH